MKAKHKPRRIKQKIREQKKKEQRILSSVFVAAILVFIIFISGFFVNSMLNQPSTSQPVSSTFEPKAAIVDQLSLTYPNQTFVETATNTLEQTGYSVDYYLGEQATVDFYRNLPTHDYDIIILRVHSYAHLLQGEEALSLVCFFTSEPYSKTKYINEQLTDQLAIASYGLEPPFYFGILPKFITQSMNGNFHGATIIMTGCEGLNNTKMAEAFIEKGAKVYIGWNKSVQASHTDQATICLLQHLITEKQTIRNAITQTMKDVGADPVDNSLLIYYPPNAGEQAIEKITAK